MNLADTLRPCGPVVDAPAAERVREALVKAAEREGWTALLDRVWPALEPICAASPYLAGLMRRGPERLRATLEAAPQDRMADILARTAQVAQMPDLSAGGKALRGLKAEAHLAIALADLGGSGTWRP